MFSHKIHRTFFDSYVDDLIAFLASGEVQNDVVIIVFFLNVVKLLYEVVNMIIINKLHIQNRTNATKITFNLTCDETINLRNKLLFMYS